MLVVCRNCDSKVLVPDESAGKKGKCPKCGHVFTVGGAAAGTGPDDEGISAGPPTAKAGVQSLPKTPRRVEEDEPPPRRRYDDEDEDEDDEGRLRRLRRSPENNPLSLTSMIVGIVSASLGLFACVCWPFVAIIVILAGATAVVLGFVGRSRGATPQALTGIITGFAGIVLGIMWLIGYAIFLGVVIMNAK
jgi:predicted Zn finger-like uncharacterized protein